MMQNVKLTSVDQYIAEQPETVRPALEQMRNVVRAAAPNAEEVISYGMPAFKQNGMLVYFAAWKSHLGFYPSGSGIKDFAAELTHFKTSKGAIRFPLSEPLPEDLISRIVKFRVTENNEKAMFKTSAKNKK